MPQMDPSAVDLVLAVRAGYGQDARTHACPWGLLDGWTAFAKLIKPGTSCCEAISGKNIRKSLSKIPA